MKIDTLEAALCMMRARGDWTEDDLKDIDSALDEIADCKTRGKDLDDIWHGDVHIIHTNDTIDLVNKNLYDMYGRMMRQNQNLVELDLFLMACYGGSVDCLGFEHWPAKALEDGYWLVKDLWYENETYGFNNPDGTFSNKAETTAGPTRY